MRGATAVLVVLLAACSTAGGDSATTAPLAEPSSTTTTEPSTTTTTEPTTTTTVEEDPVELCVGRSVVWEPSIVYRAGCFAEPLRFRPAVGGWRSRSGTSDSLLVTWVDPENREFRADLGIAAANRADDLETALTSLLQRDGLVPVGDQTATSIAGQRAVTIDIDGEKHIRLVTEGGSGEPECYPWSGEAVRHFKNDAYPIVGPLVSQGGEFFGVGSCQRVRVWITDIGNHRLTLIGGTVQAIDHDRAMEVLEGLLDSIEFIGQ